jgi:hypothetical protein
MGYAELLQFMADEILKKLDPMERKASPAPDLKRVVKNKKPFGKRVPIPAAVRWEVWMRDQAPRERRNSIVDA